ncbi:pimeloyl-ACP methyl ester carboxylesterase [Actinokineospora auranticolor]|uniref:Pimeloyl-ACP methyl ester carboxylesterase n=2 Tax=Actinokineospora auranticolor TaxID=155976 RepID=A0A2S6GGH1_9PSEU|nr:pimeloyl-ACP methyl ester carboxylesterase [Actinokineospora auranticolor]
MQKKWPVPSVDIDIETRYGPTRVRRSGPTDGIPIVLLPGIMGTSLSWYPHVADLAAGHPVYAVDTMGEAGHSVQTRALETDDDLAAWLGDLLTGLCHDKAHLVGLSRGGYLALHLAVRSGDRLASVLAFEPSGFSIVGPRFILWSLVEIGRWLLPAPILRLVAKGDPTVRHTFRSLLFAGFKYKARIPPQHLFTDDELRAIEVSTRHVLAERSNVVKAHEVAARVEALNPRVRAEVVPGADHTLSLTQPGLVTDRILDLADGHRVGD